MRTPLDPPGLLPQSKKLREDFGIRTICFPGVRPPKVLNLNSFIRTSAGPVLDSGSAVQTGEGQPSGRGSCCVELPAKLRDSQGTERLRSSRSFTPPTSLFGECSYRRYPGCRDVPGEVRENTQDVFDHPLSCSSSASPSCCRRSTCWPAPPS